MSAAQHNRQRAQDVLDSISISLDIHDRNADVRVSFDDGDTYEPIETLQRRSDAILRRKNVLAALRRAHQQ